MAESIYWIDLRDPSGTRRRLPALDSRRASEAFARNVEALRDCMTARERPDKALLQWTEGLTTAARERLARYGFIDGERAYAAQGLAVHLADYETDMRARECNPRHVRQEVAKIRRMMQGCGFKVHSDIRADKLQKWLGVQREQNNMGARTANSYATAFVSFLNWMIPNRATVNPLAHMHRYNERADVRRERRALAPDELARLLSATEEGEPWRGMSGPERALLYRVAMETGLRWEECRSLRRLSFALDSNPPAVTVEAAYAKNGKTETLPLRKELADALRSFFSESLAMPSARAFPNMPAGGVGAKMIRYDLGHTGNPDAGLEPIPYRDDQNRVADFHSLRHGFCSALAASGVHPSVAQSLARHSTITLTMDRYTHATLESRQKAIEKLPDYSAIAQAEAARKTGTDDTKPGRSGCARFCAIPMQNDRKPSDTIGQATMKKAAGAESLNSLPDNEKALQDNALQGVGVWHPPDDFGRTRKRRCWRSRASA